MKKWIKDFLGHVNGVSDDDNFRYAILNWGLVDIAPNGKEFCFSTGDMNHVMDSLGDRVIEGVHMQYRCSDVILDTSICDNDGSRGRVRCFNDYIVKLLSAGFIAILFAM